METMQLSQKFWELVESICKNIEKVYIVKVHNLDDGDKSYNCYVLTDQELLTVHIVESDSMMCDPAIIHKTALSNYHPDFLDKHFKKYNFSLAVKEPEIVQVPAPAFYAERGISKVRWMYPGKAYKARLMTMPLDDEQAIMYVHVLDDEHVMAYKDAEWQHKIGKLQLEHFMLIQHLSTVSNEIVEDQPQPEQVSVSDKPSIVEVDIYEIHFTPKNSNESYRAYGYINYFGYIVLYGDEALTKLIAVLKECEHKMYRMLMRKSLQRYLVPVTPKALLYGDVKELAIVTEELPRIADSAPVEAQLEDNAPISAQVGPIERKVDRIAPKKDTQEAPAVKVAVLPPDPPAQYEQLSLF